MIYSTLANTGVKVSPIGLGTVKIGRDKGVKYPSAFKIPEDAEVLNLLALAKDLGINLLDTAPAYGNSESRLGQLLGPQIKDWVICSKAGEFFDNQSGESHFDFTEKGITQSVEQSLKRLNTDHIDILMIHSDGNDLEVIEQYGALATINKLKQQGKVLATGMSTKTVAGGIEALRQADCAMVTYNLQQQEELPVIQFAAEHNKGIFIKKAFASGHIDHTTAHRDPALESLSLIFSQPGVTSAVIGTITEKHLRQNVTYYQQVMQQLGISS